MQVDVFLAGSVVSDAEAVLRLQQWNSKKHFGALVKINFWAQMILTACFLRSAGTQ